MKSLQEMRSLDVSSLQNEVELLKRAFFDSKISLLTGQMKDTSQFTKTRKAIARAMTVLKEKARV